MKRNIYWERQKELRRLKETWYELKQQQRNLGYEELNIPRFKGYYAKLVLRTDVARRLDADVFQEIINKFGIQSRLVKKIEDYPWVSNKKRLYSFYTKPHIRSIHRNEYDLLRPQVKKYFTQSFLQIGKDYICTVPSFYFEIVYEKYYITKVKIYDEILEQQIKEIYKEIYKFYYDYKIFDDWFERAPKHYRKMLNVKRRRKNKQLLQKFDNFYEDLEITFDDNYKDSMYYF